MFPANVKLFLSVLNRDALVFLGMRLVGTVLSTTSVVLLCRAATVQRYFFSDGKGQLFDMLPLGPLVYSLTWSMVSLILPGCQRKYHPALDMALDAIGWISSFGVGSLLLNWALHNYEVDLCRELSVDECLNAAQSLSSTERSSAVLLMLNGITHLVMFIRACVAVHLRRKQCPSRNSFMQLEKSTDRRPKISPFDLNTTKFVAGVEREKRQDHDTTSADTGKVNRSNSSHGSPV